MKRQVYSVSSVNQYIKSLFMDDYALNHIYVRGEVSNCKYHSSGHIYFTLKDQGGQIACVMFAGNRRGLTFQLKEGMSVVAFGNVSIYERDGRYQLYVREMTQEGIGRLYEQYEALKNKLYSEGLFDPAHKKTLPSYPHKVGIVTARTGAAIQDMINVSLRRNPYIQLVFCSAQVQGEGAAETIVRAIHALETYGVDVMIVGRGGGSIEDLWAFNEESVARAVYACGIPIVSAVGHETDTTIIDYVSDLRAPTPSAAAELVVPDIRQTINQIEQYERLLDNRMHDIIDKKREQLQHDQQMLRYLNPEFQMNEKRQLLMTREEHLNLLMQQCITNARNKLAVDVQQLNGLSPLKQLERGYSYVSDSQEHGITKIGQVHKGDLLTIAVTDGAIQAEVTTTWPLRRE